MREKVLFLEDDDSARSRMAVGRYEIRTASPFPARAPQPEVVGEVGIPILARPGAHTREYQRERFHLVYAICDQAGEPCPAFPGRVICWSIPDPAGVAVSGDPLSPYRQVRDHFGV